MANDTELSQSIILHIQATKGEKKDLKYHKS